MLCIGIMVHGKSYVGQMAPKFVIMFYIAHAKLSFVSGSDLTSFPGSHPGFCCLQYVKKRGIIYYVSDVRVERRVEHG